MRPPGPTFAAGLTSAGEGAPHLALALQQHQRYCEALRACGLEVTEIAPLPAYPDGTFVEDAAVVTARGAIITRPGAPTRRGETETVAQALRSFYPVLHRIEAPGTVDGGDVCEAAGHFFIGLSARTNESGARQLQSILEALGYRAEIVDIRASAALLHLKTGIAYLGDGVWVIAGGMERELPALRSAAVRDVIAPPADERYAANCVRVNDAVLVPAGCPTVAAEIERRGFHALPLDVSEFRKMDGGLSCLSLRVPNRV